MIRYFLYVSLCLFFKNVLSQNRISTSSDNGWYMYFGNHKIANRVSLHTEYQWRRNNIISNWQQSLARVGVDYLISDKFSVTTGYGIITTWQYGEQPIAYKFNEHRVWQQFIAKQNTGIFYFNHRYRLEQRWLESKIQNANGEFVSDKYVYRNRVRYRLMLNIPLAKKQLENKTWFVSFYDEAFVSFGKNVSKNIFDQNRIYGAIGYLLHKNLNVQLGYMYHTVLKPDAIHIENNNNLQLAITYNLSGSLIE